MQRITSLSALTISVPNPAQQQQAGPLPVTLSLIQMIMGADGKQVGYPSQVQQPAVDSDINDEVLAILNAQVGYLGLALIRSPSADA